MKRRGTQATADRSKVAAVDIVYRRARKTARTTEDDALNALCDARLRAPRYPLAPLLKKLEYELEE